MASETLFNFHRSPDPDRRLGVALLASALLHALLLTSLSGHSVRGNVFARPVHAPLSVRLERLPELPEAAPIVISDRRAFLRRKLYAPKPVETTVPAQIEPIQFEPGVSVSDIAYLRPIPGRANSPLLASGEFRRGSEISERPEAIAMRVPVFPQLAQEQKRSGWVVVMLFVDEGGKVVDTATVESSESFSDFEKDVAAALRGSTFTPGKLAGQAVKSLAFARVRFDFTTLADTETAGSTSAPVEVENEEKH